MRALRRLFAVLSLVAMGYFAAALVGALVPGRISEVEGERDQQVLLVAGPIHYDILFPLTDETRAAFGFLNEAGLPITYPNANWLAVGWGSEAFYTATGTYADLDLATVWTAARGDSSVLRFEVLGDVSVGGKIRPVAVSDEQLTRLRGEVLKELKRDVRGAPILLKGVQLSGRDVFYYGKTGFSALRTCNVWVGQVMRRAGIPMGFWTPTPYAITLSLRWYAV